MPSHNAIITLSEVSKHYEQGLEIIRAVDDVSVDINQGDFVVITGRSGSGKTTLLSLIGGLTNPTLGNIRLFDENLSKINDDRLSTLRAETMGFVFQFASLIPTLNALDNVRLPGLFAGKDIPKSHAIQLLQWVGLGEKRINYPSQLSGGQQARVAFARSLANDPDLLLADEPTGNLDVETEREILDLLADVNREQGTTILLVTHNPALAEYGNRHLVMDQGAVTEVNRNEQPQEVVVEQ